MHPSRWKHAVKSGLALASTLEPPPSFLTLACHLMHPRPRRLCSEMNMALGSVRSAFVGKNMAFQSASCAKVSARPLVAPIQASGKVCELTGQKRNKANNVSFSVRRTRKFQEVNLQEKKVFWERGQRWVQLRISTRAMRTLEKKGLECMAKEAGLDLASLDYVDARPARLAYLAANPRKVPVAANTRAIKNQEKIASSKKVRPLPLPCHPGRPCRRPALPLVPSIAAAAPVGWPPPLPPLVKRQSAPANAILSPNCRSPNTPCTRRAGASCTSGRAWRRWCLASLLPWSRRVQRSKRHPS